MVGWNQVVGLLGMVCVLVELIELNGFNDKSNEYGIMCEGLECLKCVFVKLENINCLKFNGLKVDWILVLFGGLLIMFGVFVELDVDCMDVIDGVLCLGVLYDLFGCMYYEDMCMVMIEQFMCCYSVDCVQVSCVCDVVIVLLLQFFDLFDECCEDNFVLLGWVVNLYEIGMSILYSGYYKYLVYIVSYVDMLGFFKIDQVCFVMLLLGYVGKLGKFLGGGKFLDWWMLFSLCLVFVLCWCWGVI